MWPSSLMFRPVPSKEAMETPFQQSFPKSKGPLSIKISNLPKSTTGGSWEPLKLIHTDQNDNIVDQDVNGNCNNDAEILESMVHQLVGVNVSELHIPGVDDNGGEVEETCSDHSQNGNTDENSGVSITELDEKVSDETETKEEEVPPMAVRESKIGTSDSSPEPPVAEVEAPAALVQPEVASSSVVELEPVVTGSTLIIDVKNPADYSSVNESVSQNSLGTENLLKVVTNDVKVSNETLTTLVVHRKGTNELLKLMAESAKNLKILDVKGSPGVTNEGIQYLFVGEKMASLSSGLSSVSWKVKHAQRWTSASVCSSLELLDISYTGANHCSKKLVTMMPGVHWFARQWFADLGHSTGHYVFLKKEPALEFKMKDLREYRIKLSVLLGSRSSNALQKLALKHQWSNCLATVRLSNKLKKEGQILMTACEDDRRISGELLFQGGEVTGLYSYFPMDVNVVLEACPKLQKLSSPLTHACLGNQLALHLTALNTLCDVNTMTSLLPHCLRLKSLKWRLSGGLLDDQMFLKMALESKCFGRLEELWIVPACVHLNKAAEAASLGRVESRCLRRAKSSVGRLHAAPAIGHSSSSRHQTSSRRIATAVPWNNNHQGAGVVLKPVRKISVVSTVAQQVDVKLEVGLAELNMGSCDGRCLLSMESFNMALKACPKLEKIGNLLFWERVTATELGGLRDEKLRNPGVAQVPEVETEEVPKWDFDVSTGWNMG